MNQAEKLTILRSVSFLAELDERSLAEVAARVREQRFPARARIISELEFGTDVYIIAEGEVEVSVHAVTGSRQILGTFGQGASFGEMASLTGELRSATVRALTPVKVLIIVDRDFDNIRYRRPEIAVSLLRVLGQRLRDAEQTLKSLLLGPKVNSALAAPKLPRSTLSLLWRELVVNHEKDLAFLTLASFSVTLAVVRLAVFLAFKFDYAPMNVLRAAYVSGFGLVITSACAALLTFRPTWRRAIAFAFGIGAALIVNELGVTLAFDIFYKDIHTRDSAVAFDIERLYRRTEPMRAAVIGLLLLVQAVYLKSFYARSWYLLRVRVLHSFRRRRG